MRSGAGERQKTLAAHGVPISDERLPIDMLDMRQLTAVEGRILVHGQDEQSGQSYLILEGTDAKVHFIHYTPEMDQARSRGLHTPLLLLRSFERGTGALVESICSAKPPPTGL